jgi:hypothetical protein
MRLPRATGLASSSQVALGSQSSGSHFGIARISEGFKRLAQAVRVLPVACAQFVPAFAVFHLADPQ